MSSKVVKFANGYLIIISNDVTGEQEFSFAPLSQEVSA